MVAMRIPIYLCSLALTLAPLRIFAASIAQDIQASVESSLQSRVDWRELDLVLQATDAIARQHDPLDDATASRLTKIVEMAHTNGLPLGAMLYPKWPDDENIRLLLGKQVVRSSRETPFGWDAFESLVSSLLETREPPPQVFNASRVQQGLDTLVRSALLDNLRRLLESPGDLGTDLSRATPTNLATVLKEASIRIKEPARLQRIVESLSKVEAFNRSPPPFPSTKWQAAAAKFNTAIKAFGAVNAQPQTNAPDQTTEPPKPSPVPKVPEAKPAPTPSEEPTSSTPWSVVAVLIVAAIGLLWLLLKGRK